jgi:hypothetical protein
VLGSLANHIDAMNDDDRITSKSATTLHSTTLLHTHCHHDTLSPPHHRHVLHRTDKDSIGAARYVETARSKSLYTPTNRDLDTGSPSTALQPFRAAQVVNAAWISSSTKKPAETAPNRALGPSNIQGAPGPPPPMKAVTGKDHREVALPSQEGNNSVVQYAL